MTEDRTVRRDITEDFLTVTQFLSHRRELPKVGHTQLRDAHHVPFSIPLCLLNTETTSKKSK